MTPDRQELFLRAMEYVSDQEASYAADWSNDTDSLLREGFYDTVSSIVDPQDGEMIVDIGTGTGFQLISLAAQNPRGVYIGTERTRANVIAAYTRLQQENLHRFFSVIANSEMRGTADGKAFWWRDMEFLRSVRNRIRHQLDVEGKLMIFDDNILYPEVLPAILDGGKIDAGIMSMPGGSSSRAIEWPLNPGGHEGVPTDELHRRIVDVSDKTRYAFYHFMSEHVRPGGRIIVAERMLRDPTVDIPKAGAVLIGKHMGGLAEYWEPKGGAFMKIDLRKTNVALRAIDEEGNHTVESKTNQGHDAGVIIYRLNRNDTPFNEPPLSRPIEAV